MIRQGTAVVILEKHSNGPNRSDTSTERMTEASAAEAQPQTTATRQGAAIRFRAALAILVLVPSVVFFMVWGNWRVGGTGPMDAINGPAVAVLCGLIALNLLLRRVRPSWTLSPGELITIYVALAISAGITGGVWNWGGNLAPSIAYPVWLAGPANRWAEIMWPYLPPGMTVMDRDALQGFFLGSSSPYRWDVLLAWAQPIFWWTAWLTVTLWVTMCLSVIVRRRWVDEEKLPFPMTMLPVQLTEPGERIFHNPVFWIGIAVSVGMGLLDLLNFLVPTVPTIPTYLDISTFLSNNRPWDAIRTTSLAWGPWQLGLSYLMPVDLTFSLIVFNLLWKAEYIFFRMTGWLTSAWDGFPYGNQQVIGGYLALMASVVWLDRHYLEQVIRKAFGLSSRIEDGGEAFGYRTAVFGAIGGIAFLWWFFSRSGMGAPIIAAFLVLFFVMVMVMVRLRAQLGPPSHWMYGTMPEFVLTQFPGTRAIGPGGLGLIAMLRPFMYEQDQEPAPAQLEALRMADRVNANPSRMAWILVAVIPLMMVSYFWANLHIGYHYGLGSKSDPDMTQVCRQATDKLDDWLRGPGGPNWSGVESIGIGFLITIALMYVKLRSPLWPLHPLAFPLAFSWTIDSMLPAIFITWVFKVLLLRYGGLRAHRRALPFFLALLAGTACMSLLQTALLRFLGLEHP